jgi:AcrR family transcriptional regulator
MSSMKHVERADAARNRERILEAAAALFEERGVERVSMDAIAAAAGVGKGTLFRRFGDRAGLARALVEQRNQDLRRAVLCGAPPLGPGAPPVERLRAFMAAAAVLACRCSGLLAEYESACGTTRHSDDHHGFWLGHLSSLVAAAGDDANADFLAHVLLNAVSGDLVQHLLVEREMSSERITHGAAALAHAALAQPSGARARRAAGDAPRAVEARELPGG